MLNNYGRNAMVNCFCNLIIDHLILKVNLFLFLAIFCDYVYFGIFVTNFHALEYNNFN